jgi:hypothetical protein
LAAYCAEAHGGPTTYTDAMLRLHSGNGEQEDMDARAQGCFALALDLAALPHDERLRSTLKSMSSQAYASKPIVERIRSSRARTRGQVLLAGDEGVHVKRSLGSPLGGRPGCQAVSAAGAGRWPRVPRPVGVLVASGGG